jgi:hypothetical protein
LQDDISDLNVLKERSRIRTTSDFLEYGRGVSVIPRFHGPHELRQGFICVPQLLDLLLQLAILPLQRNAPRLGLLGGVFAFPRVGGASEAHWSMGITLESTENAHQRFTLQNESGEPLPLLSDVCSCHTRQPRPVSVAYRLQFRWRAGATLAAPHGGGVGARGWFDGWLSSSVCGRHNVD